MVKSDWAVLAAVLSSLASLLIVAAAVFRIARHVTRFVQAVDDNTKAITALSDKMADFASVSDGRLTSMEDKVSDHETRISHLEGAAK